MVLFRIRGFSICLDLLETYGDNSDDRDIPEDHIEFRGAHQLHKPPGRVCIDIQIGERWKNDQLQGVSKSA